MHTHTSSHSLFAPVEITAPTFVVGQNCKGQWLAIESDGSGGGIFADREAAIRYASAETNRRPDAVRLAGESIELRF